jgi:hypothetical protein
MPDATHNLRGLVTGPEIQKLIKDISKKIWSTYGRRLEKDDIPGWVGLGISRAAVKLDRKRLKRNKNDKTRQVMSWLTNKGYWETITVLRLAKMVDRKINGEIRRTTIETINASACGHDGEDGKWIGIDPPDAAPVVGEGAAASDFYEWAVGKLRYIECEVVYYHYTCKLPMSTIGKILSLSEARVSQIHSSSLRIIRSELEE